MTRVSMILATVLATACALPAVGAAQVVVGPGGGTPGTAKNFKLIGHDPLFARGMNAAPAIFGDYLYVGNRTDGSSSCGVDESGVPIPGHCSHPHPAISIVDIAEPEKPTLAGEIGPPYAGLPGTTTRELRVWPQKKLLMVMTFNCSAQLHACAPTPAGAPSRDAAFAFDIKFFDLSDPRHPRFLSSYVPTSKAGEEVKPHEMFLWVDPKHTDRALLWLSTPSTSSNPDRPNLMVVDISDVAAGGEGKEVAEGNWNQFYPGAADAAPTTPTFLSIPWAFQPTGSGRIWRISAATTSLSTRARWPTTFTRAGLFRSTTICSRHRPTDRCGARVHRDVSMSAQNHTPLWKCLGAVSRSRPTRSTGRSPTPATAARGGGRA